jgi:lysophospholipase L1-like esterase
MKIIQFALWFCLLSCQKQVAHPSMFQVGDGVKKTLSDSASEIVCAGNSLTYGYHLAEPSTQSYPAQLIGFAPYSTNGSVILNKGVNGITTEQMQPRIATDILPNYDSSKINLVIAWEVGNDIFWNGTTGAAAYDSFVVYCDSVRSHGWKVAVITNPYRNNYFMGYPTTPGGDDSTAYSSKLSASNGLIRANWASFSDYLVDLGADSAFSSYSTLNYQTDHVHLTQAGYYSLDSMVVSALGY